MPGDPAPHKIQAPHLSVFSFRTECRCPGHCLSGSVASHRDAGAAPAAACLHTCANIVTRCAGGEGTDDTRTIVEFFMETPGSRDSSALALLEPVLMLIRLGLLITDSLHPIPCSRWTLSAGSAQSGTPGGWPADMKEGLRDIAQTHCPSSTHAADEFDGVVKSSSKSAGSTSRSSFRHETQSHHVRHDLLCGTAWTSLCFP